MRIGRIDSLLIYTFIYSSTEYKNCILYSVLTAPSVIHVSRLCQTNGEMGG